MGRYLGTAVFCGMLGVTVLGIFLTPVFSYVIRRAARTGGPRRCGRAWLRQILFVGLDGAMHMQSQINELHAQRLPGDPE
jgi:hypothetical protein